MDKEKEKEKEKRGGEGGEGREEREKERRGEGGEFLSLEEDIDWVADVDAVTYAAASGERERERGEREREKGRERGERRGSGFENGSLITSDTRDAVGAPSQIPAGKRKKGFFAATDLPTGIKPNSFSSYSAIMRDDPGNIGRQRMEEQNGVLRDGMRRNEESASGRRGEDGVTVGRRLIRAYLEDDAVLHTLGLHNTFKTVVCV